MKLQDAKREASCGSDGKWYINAATADRRYAGYNKVTSGTHCGCWAHVRRKFLEAIPGGDPSGEQAQGSKVKEGFEFCEKLFMLERKFAELSS